MKKMLLAVLMMVTFVVGLFSNAENTKASNVGDGQEYAYEITEIVGDEVYGLPLNKKSSDNCGIFLYASEIGFEVNVGDDIIVVWGEEEDEFKLIDKAVLNKNNEYVSTLKNMFDSMQSYKSRKF